MGTVENCPADSRKAGGGRSLLFANADVQVRKQVRGMEIISRRYLPVYLERLPKRMGAAEAEKIFEILKISKSQMFV